jgi:lysophospholipase L1-like esterase
MPRTLAFVLFAACLLLPDAPPLAGSEPPVAAASSADPRSPEQASERQVTGGGERIRRLLPTAPRIVFLGDSITYSGQYVAFFDAWLLTQKLLEQPVVIDAGLPSETVSGLSEQGHAGGKFPRPDLAERLARVLAATRPNLVFACYGINCGIYQPLDEERFRRYQQGFEKLKQQVEANGATLVVVTPPYFDDQRAKKPFSYNGVLDHYTQWLLSRREDGWLVVDLHGPMTREVARRRTADPAFTFQPDAVHPGAEGHWFMASQLLRWLGDGAAADAPSPQAMLAAHQISPDVLPLVQQRVNVLRDAYLSAAGHQRPGIRAGLPLEKAQPQAEQLTRRIQQLLDGAP